LYSVSFFLLENRNTQINSKLFQKRVIKEEMKRVGKEQVEVLKHELKFNPKDLREKGW